MTAKRKKVIFGIENNQKKYFLFQKMLLLAIMKDRLKGLGNVPVTTSTLSALYPEIKGINNKVCHLCEEGALIRLKRGLFVVTPGEDDERLCLGLIANHIYSPSYVSMQTALRFYGLIPEGVQTIQSMTVNHTKSFNTPLGMFTYTETPRDGFATGVTQVTYSGATFVIATPERALCDTVANSAGVNIRYKIEAEKYITEDLRLDMDAFCEMDPEILESYAETGKKGSSIHTLVKLLRHERSL